jgi:hypothetical protein
VNRKEVCWLRAGGSTTSSSLSIDRIRESSRRIFPKLAAREARPQGRRPRGNPFGRVWPCWRWLSQAERLDRRTQDSIGHAGVNDSLRPTYVFEIRGLWSLSAPGLRPSRDSLKTPSSAPQAEDFKRIARELFPHSLPRRVLAVIYSSVDPRLMLGDSTPNSKRVG